MGKEIKISLDLPDIEVLEVEESGEGDYFITVRSTKKTTNCRKCGSPLTHIHGYDDPITLRHLPVFGKEVYVIIHPARFRCPFCSDHPTTTQRLSWYQPRSPSTKAYEEHVLLQLINSTVEDVSIKENIGYESVMGIIGRHIGAKVDWKAFQTLGALAQEKTDKKTH